jgi:hypothetical protein
VENSKIRLKTAQLLLKNSFIKFAKKSQKEEYANTIITALWVVNNLSLLTRGGVSYELDNCL